MDSDLLLRDDRFVSPRFTYGAGKRIGSLGRQCFSGQDHILEPGAEARIDRQVSSFPAASGDACAGAGQPTPPIRPGAPFIQLPMGQSPHIRTSLSGVEVAGVTAAGWPGI
jgi:hypothetical protein